MKTGSDGTNDKTPCRPVRDWIVYPFHLTLDTLEMFRRIYGEWEAGTPAGVISRRFHAGLILGLADAAETLCRERTLTHVGLSGGVMLNLTLAEELPRELRRRGLAPLTHHELPPGDGSISLGQADWGMRRLRRS